MTAKDTIMYADDDYESISTLLKLRAPALVIGLLLGIIISFVVSGFKEVLSQNIAVAFFLPFVVYIADAIGTQTEAIYSRDLRSGRAKFGNYFRKEAGVGMVAGAVFGVCSGTFAWLWLRDAPLAISVALATLIASAIAPLVALFVTYSFQAFGKDPAAGAGPIITVIQDMASVLVYGLITSSIML